MARSETGNVSRLAGDQVSNKAHVSVNCPTTSVACIYSSETWTATSAEKAALRKMAGFRIVERVGKSRLRNFSAARGSSSRIPSHLATEPSRFALRNAATEHLGTRTWSGKANSIPCSKSSGLSVAAWDAFRHGNETVIDGEGVPMATRQNRLGHSDARTTMKYTHVISEDGRKIAARFGELLTSSPTVTMAVGNA